MRTARAQAGRHVDIATVHVGQELDVQRGQSWGSHHQNREVHLADGVPGDFGLPSFLRLNRAEGVHPGGDRHGNMIFLTGTLQ